MSGHNLCFLCSLRKLSLLSEVLTEYRIDWSGLKWSDRQISSASFTDLGLLNFFLYEYYPRLLKQTDCRGMLMVRISNLPEYVLQKKLLAKKHISIFKIFNTFVIYDPCHSVCALFHLFIHLSVHPEVHPKSYLFWTYSVYKLYIFIFGTYNQFYTGNPNGVLAKSADSDQMPHYVASDLGLNDFAVCSAIFQQKYHN